MSRSATITALKKYFKVKELVCPHTYQKYGESSWQFLSTCYLETLLVIREQILAVSMYCNTSNHNQRGLRCNLCPIVANKQSLYLSAHILGKAGDFTVRGLTSEEVRNKIIQNAHLLPHSIRLENNVTWLHIDTLPQKTSAGTRHAPMGKEVTEVWITSCINAGCNHTSVFYSTFGAELPVTSECSFDATSSLYFGGMPTSIHTIDGVET